MIKKKKRAVEKIEKRNLNVVKNKLSWEERQRRAKRQNRSEFENNSAIKRYRQKNSLYRY